MADEHSFDIGCQVDMQEVTNAVNQSMKEIAQRFDFKGSKSSIEIDKGNNTILVTSDDEFKLKNVLDILQGKLVKREVSLKALSYGKVEPAAASTVRQKITLQQGVPIDKAKEIVKIIKDMKLKVSSEIQGDSVRVRGKKLDDLQLIIEKIKGQDFDIHLQFTNYR
ncbi:MAG: YajQ family cyclic di-GMP-binding protein [Nitrospirota bacterium]|uniref:Nucleotide-binding protein ASN18_0889 n=1 Tax=Candidatus Magnetominusculus xianensis TaxID=1748249 RepID=A0ABR5SIM3_9BACT|nr:YajQ family cyclic di-GMP-binding protein [Candidatus Magnetominusculus xianensis]KWT91065.1 putative nucleotide-binding protein [Candidatus Magnetominusculus xianensis]MBF0403290.1 YajQ family cyclic di-GMP-binding protein [Nitrospirota bacterium]